MKILHINLSEYTTLEELHTAFNELGPEVSKHGCQLMNSKKGAEKNLKYQYEKFNTLGSRIFWWKKGVYNDNVTFILNEAKID